ncbi:hypothetical protein EI94DRAFT_1705431 [Lactarius quietus]|nr:hypothetical protein EI94DRAFT_1705431 [Lactarius quietus]
MHHTPSVVSTIRWRLSQSECTFQSVYTIYAKISAKDPFDMIRADMPKESAFPSQGLGRRVSPLTGTSWTQAVYPASLNDLDLSAERSEGHLGNTASDEEILGQSSISGSNRNTGGRVHPQTIRVGFDPRVLGGELPNELWSDPGWLPWMPEYCEQHSSYTTMLCGVSPRLCMRMLKRYRLGTLLDSELVALAANGLRRSPQWLAYEPAISTIYLLT